MPGISPCCHPALSYVLYMCCLLTPHAHPPRQTLLSPPLQERVRNSPGHTVSGSPEAGLMESPVPLRTTLLLPCRTLCVSSRTSLLKRFIILRRYVSNSVFIFSLQCTLKTRRMKGEGRPHSPVNAFQLQ